MATITPSNGQITIDTFTLTGNCTGTQTTVAPTSIDLVVEDQQGRVLLREHVPVT